MKKSKNSQRWGLTLIALCLLGSAMMRAGSVGIAIANEPPADDTELQMTEASLTPPSASLAEVEELMVLLRTRTAELDRREAELAEKERAANAARILIEQNLAQLEETEARLASTINQVGTAAQDDISRLTQVYETMKPKGAAALFEQMNPEFAAGFLASMNSQAAAAIMTSLSSEKAYAISVVLAGRNAQAPTE